MSYFQVSSELLQQTDGRLHRAARDTGLELARRLYTLSAVLPEATVDSSGLRWVARVDANHPPHAVKGKPDAHLLRRVAEAELADPGLLVVRATDAEARVMMVSGPADGVRFVAELDPTALFAFSHENTLTPNGDFLVIGAGALLATSLEGVPKLPRDWLVGDPPRKLMDWSHGGEDYLARPWSLFLGAGFGARPWTTILIEPRDAALAPLRMFRQGFVLAVLLVFLLVPLLATFHIRRSLVPLERLREGALRIRKRDLTARVHVESHDEFEEVAGSFNQMAEFLETHIGSLDALLEIDREILAAADERTVVETLVRHAPTLAPCTLAAFGVAAGQDGSAQEFGTLAAHRGGDAVVSLNRAALDPAETGLVQSEGEPRDLALADERTPLLAGLREAGATHATLLPLRVGQSLLGILALGRSGAEPPAVSSLAYVRQLADEAAAALLHLREREQRRLLGSYDSLTGLPNRKLFRERLGQALRTASRQESVVGVCILVIDEAKRFVQTLGPAAGDQLLQEASRRLLQTLPGGDVFRIAEDEFAVVLAGLGRLDAAADTARRLLAELACPFVLLDSQEVFTAASAGIAVSPEDGDTVDLLMRNAAAAARQARSSGRGRLRFYSALGQDAAQENLALESALRRAAERGELQLRYQPIIETATGDLIAAEALMRWIRPDGLVSPEIFIPVAEGAGLIGDLDEWALDRACRDLRGWIDQGLPPLQMHVNISLAKLDGDRVLTCLRAAIAGSQIPPQALELELTETMFIDGDEATLHLLHRIREEGVGLAIDDFGTGYASLGYVRRFPVDTLKIDKLFVGRVDRDRGDAAIVRAVLALARGLGLKVVAEGVETEATLAFLREEGCDEAQGYLFAKPMEADAFQKYLAERAAAGEVVDLPPRSYPTQTATDLAAHTAPQADEASHRDVDEGRRTGGARQGEER
jgi:diguanylate cyclase (GGDEF)-like protein